MGFLKGTKPRRRVLGRMARAALESSVLFGASVMGTNGQELEVLRGAAGKLPDHRQDGKSRTLSLLLSPVPRLDPIFRATWLPVKFYLHALWHRWLPHEALDFGLREARKHLSGLEHPWSSIRGPFCALWASLR
eukprot:2063722-Pyramimonas_sp.AAC.1